MRHDQSYNAVFSYAQAVQDPLEGLVAPQLEGGRKWMQRLDFTTLEPLPLERIDPTLRGRSNDLVWRIRFRKTSGGSAWLHVLMMLEFQSGVDWFMALWVQGYAVRPWQGLWRSRRAGREGRLPPVLAVVFYNGKAEWRAATTLADLIGEETRSAAWGAAAGPAFAGESYVLVDVSSYQGGALPPNNLASLVVATERMRGLKQAGAMLEAALRQLSGRGLEAARDTHLEWFRLLAG